MKTYSRIETSGKKYYEIKRTSTTNVVFTVYNDSDFTDVYQTTSATIPSTITGLRYFKVANWHSSGSGSCTSTGYFDDLKVYDDITSITTITNPKVMAVTEMKVQANTDEELGNSHGHLASAISTTSTSISLSGE